MAFVYHGSDKENLDAITPRVSTHGKKYVYATEHKPIALLFLSRWNDFLLTLGISRTGNKIHISLTERYANAFGDIYSRKKGFLYTLDAANFFSPPDVWEMEVVSRYEEKPLSCERIDDVLAEIEKLKESGDISLYYYPERPANIPADDADLIRKCIELYELSGDKYNAVYCAERFPSLKARIYGDFLERYGIDLSSAQYGKTK